ncbi:unnamed protein product [Linum trigynum]|uniref:Uncharacterized protein n=1 Tax=Linum trigynum TaxID=586398 RepID=A0AAV2D6G7_9ROSI
MSRFEELSISELTKMLKSKLEAEWKNEVTSSLPLSGNIARDALPKATAAASKKPMKKDPQPLSKAAPAELDFKDWLEQPAFPIELERWGTTTAVKAEKAAATAVALPETPPPSLVVSPPVKDEGYAILASSSSPLTPLLTQDFDAPAKTDIVAATFVMLNEERRNRAAGGKFPRKERRRIFAKSALSWKFRKKMQRPRDGLDSRRREDSPGSRISPGALRSAVTLFTVATAKKMEQASAVMGPESPRCRRGNDELMRNGMRKVSPAKDLKKRKHDGGFLYSLRKEKKEGRASNWLEQ